MRVTVYEIKERDQFTYTAQETYQTLRDAVQAFMRGDNVELPHAEDGAFEFDTAPNGVPDDWTDTNIDRIEFAAANSRRPVRDILPNPSSEMPFQAAPEASATNESSSQ